MFPRSIPPTLFKFTVVSTLLALVGLSITTVATAAPPSKFAGTYYGASVSNGSLLAAANVTVTPKGKVRARGLYVDGSLTSLAGRVDDAGNLALTEKHNGATNSYTGGFQNGSVNKFTFKLSTGAVFKAFKVPAGFQVAGVYAGQTDGGLRGAFVVDKAGRLGGAVIAANGAYELLSGTADATTFMGTTEIGVTFEGTFNDGGLTGTYHDKSGKFTGTFSAVRL